MGSAQNGFIYEVLPQQSIESQVPAIVMHRRHHVFHLLASSFQRRLAYILYESWLRGVVCIYTLQTSSDLNSRLVYTRNTPRNHDLNIT